MYLNGMLYEVKRLMVVPGCTSLNEMRDERVSICFKHLSHGVPIVDWSFYASALHLGMFVHGRVEKLFVYLA